MGKLHLVDLAGSERLAKSGKTRDFFVQPSASRSGGIDPKRNCEH
jgi:hypothetical protein